MGITWYRKKNISKKEYYKEFLFDENKVQEFSNSTGKQKIGDDTASRDGQNIVIDKEAKKECLEGRKIEVPNETDKYEKIKKAYDTVVRTREFEITLYWDRTKYFWAFITTIYIAYYHVLTKIYIEKKFAKP